MDILWFILATLTAIIASLYFYMVSNIKYLKDNWSSLRCNPAYMPFASYAGTDVLTNFANCAAKGFHDYAGFMMDPVMADMSTMTSGISEISSSMNEMRGMFSGVRGGFMMVFQSVFGKIANLMSSFQYLMIRIKTLIGRTVGVFASLIYVAYAGMETGVSVVGGPIGKTVNALSSL
jgi:hypothetical protein